MNRNRILLAFFSVLVIMSKFDARAQEACTHGVGSINGEKLAWKIL